MIATANRFAWTDEAFDQIRPHATVVIRATARSLKRLSKFRGVDQSDLEGDFWLHLLDALTTFDPAKGKVEPFIEVVIERFRVTMIRNRNGAKRDPDREAFSLNDRVVAEGRSENCEATFLHRDRERLRQVQKHIHDALLDAPDHLRETAPLFAHESITSIAKMRRITKEKTRYYRQALRIRLTDA